MARPRPWKKAGRGSNDGVKDRQTNTSATHAPGSVYRNLAVRAGAPAGSGGPADSSGATVVSGCVVMALSSCLG